MIIEMHSHTAEHSACSHVEAADLVRCAFEQGLQGIVLTDHHYFWPTEELNDVRRRSRVPGYFFLASGQEVTTSDFGDVLVFGADRTLPRGSSVDRIRAEFAQAALVWAHPYREEKIPVADRLLDPRLDGVEIFNSNHTFAENHRGLQDWHRYRFTAVAGTDTHALSYTGTFPTLFDHPMADIAELASELRHGRCRPFFKEIPREGSHIRIIELTLGAGVKEKIVVKALEPGNWEEADRAWHIMEELARHGFESGPFRVPRPLSRDADGMTLIEEGIKGRTLYDKLLKGDTESARTALRLSARWLARLHNCRIRLTPAGEYMQREPERLARFVSAFSDVGHKFTRRAREIAETILSTEMKLFHYNGEMLRQGHGDYNPRNILIGQDNPEDPRTIFAAAIDFNDSYCMLPAFDVGTFLAQFRNQFFYHGEVLGKVSESMFLNSYVEAADDLPADFRAQVELYRARANMCIAYYLIKVGMGESENLWRVLVEADQSLTRLAMQGF